LNSSQLLPTIDIDERSKMGFLLSVKIMGYPSSFPARGVDDYAKGMCKDLEYDIGTDFW
jgi:hypothetical protein